MLKNIKKGVQPKKKETDADVIGLVEVTVKYNQREITVKPEGTLDVRDFGVSGNDFLIKSVEKHIIKKNPGAFEQFDAKEQTELKQETFEEIQKLKKENEKLRGDVEAAQKDAADARKAEQKAKDELAAQADQNRSLKEDIKQLKAKLKSA